MIAVLYARTGVAHTEPILQLRAYSTRAEADAAKKEFDRWHSSVIKAFSVTKLIFAPQEELHILRQRWFMKLPWGALALQEDYGPADMYVEVMTFDTQEEADVEMAVINATARAAEVHLLASLL